MTPRAAIVGLSGPALTENEAALLRARPPAGIILFARNIVDPVQLAALMRDLRTVLPEGAVLLVDQEGGRVARLRPPHWRADPPAGRIGALHATDEAAGLRAAYLTGALIGHDCAEAGFDVACAPVLDLHVPGASDVVGDRSFGAAPEAVAALGAAFARGLLEAGIQPIMKHAPGHGGALVDSHLAMPEAPDISESALLPFRANAQLPWAMTAHMLFRARDADRPATLSPTIIQDVIRGAIGFDGVLASDDLAMGALQGTQAGRALAALAAGCDIALYCPGDAPGTEAVLHAVPPLTEAAQSRLARARATARAARRPRNAAAMAQERDALLACLT